jgi:hypothetical protein
MIIPGAYKNIAGYVQEGAIYNPRVLCKKHIGLKYYALFNISMISTFP